MYQPSTTPPPRWPDLGLEDRLQALWEHVRHLEFDRHQNRAGCLSLGRQGVLGRGKKHMPEPGTIDLE